MSNRLKKKWIVGFAMIGLFGAYIPSFINGSHAVYAEGENGGEKPVPVDLDGEDGENDGNGEEETPATSTTANLKVVKKMTGVAGYQPKITDVFTVQFKQIENVAKYWGGTGDAAVAPKTVVNIGNPVSGESDISEVTIAGKPSTTPLPYNIQDATKTVSQDINITDKFTGPGLYTYIVTEKYTNSTLTLGDSVWTPTPVKYLLKVKVTQDTEKKFLVTLTKLDPKTDDILKKEDLPADKSETKSETLDFTNELQERLTTVKVTHKTTGDISIIPSDQIYYVKVTVTKSADSKSTTTTFTYNGNQYPFGTPVELVYKGTAEQTLELSGVPVGSTVQLDETPYTKDGKKVNDNLGNVSTSIHRDKPSGIEGESDPEDGSNREGVSSGNYLVTDNGKGDADENSFTVTDTYQDIVNTGLDIVTSPFAAVLAIVALSGGAYIYLKRRIAE